MGAASRASSRAAVLVLRCWSGAARRGECCSGDTLVGDDGARGAPLLAGRCTLSAASCARPCIARGCRAFFVWRPPAGRRSGDAPTMS
ncbi:protein PALE CRESS, chloroplastic [Dorcoceras hygrometricum]|uniref:Protein PALE CRESS, chloroplastic n=1 Tax=Dorcoceras hygrometricum TaxID=472368 RepID=A0A2Z6ZRI1_9LAMI|nr:protein PALE CRESS, chloroplastic [Dorcoceras hygrometricum]